MALNNKSLSHVASWAGIASIAAVGIALQHFCKTTTGFGFLVHAHL
jgi:hypothetical protein